MYRYPSRSAFIAVVATGLTILSCGGDEPTPTGPGPGDPDPPAANVAPTASFTLSVDEGIAPVDITFNAAASTDPDGSITAYSWTFGDGTTDTGVQVTHSFATVGMFHVELTVVDDRAASVSVRRPVYVASPPGTGTNDLQGTVWFDSNLDGVLDTAERLLERFIVFLDADDDGRHDQGEALTFTDVDGTYTFAGLDAGTTYTVTQSLPFGWSNTTPGLPGPSPARGRVAQAEGGPSLIINGEFASIDDFPFQVALMVDDFQFCGGTLINSKWVLTAAHCIVDFILDPSGFDILYDTDDLTLGGQRVGVSTIRGTDTPWEGGAEWDMALLRLTASILMPRPFLQTPDQPEITEPGDSATAIGWGQIETGAQPNELRRVKLPIIDQTTCEQVAGFLFAAVGEGAICAGEAAGGVGACYGDSGGPLLVWSEGAWVQVGIASRIAALDDCGDIPSVYSRVSFMYDYITTTARIEDSGVYVIEWMGGPSARADFGNYH